jgi:hypothetical protein
LPPEEEQKKCKCKGLGTCVIAKEITYCCNWHVVAHEVWMSGFFTPYSCLYLDHRVCVLRTTRFRMRRQQLPPNCYSYQTARCHNKPQQQAMCFQILNFGMIFKKVLGKNGPAERQILLFRHEMSNTTNKIVNFKSWISTNSTQIRSYHLTANTMPLSHSSAKVTLFGN